jgi:elongation factor P--(R)-beta-lysine ligase
MSYKSKSQLILQNLFELRKIHAVTERLSSGRIFFIEEKMGLCDASGAVWPIGLSEYLEESNLQQGDLITFKCKITRNDPQKEAKYDECYFIKVTEIIQKNPCLDKWKNPVIPTPLPNKEFLQNQSKPFDNDVLVTNFYTSPTLSRLKFIKQRNRSLDRVNLFFKNRGFLNIETPTLVPSGGVEVYLNPFDTQYEDHRGKKWKLQLPTSPEFALKKIMTEGTSKIYQLSRAYRNQGEISKQHEPEFVMLEWYRANATLRNMMEDTQNLISTLAEYLGTHLDLPKQWPVFRVDKLFQDILSINLEEVQNRDHFYEKAKKRSPSITEKDDWDSLFYKLFMEKIEPFLEQQKACFVTHYPIQMGALASQESIKSPDKNEENTSIKHIQKPFVERMEAFLNGVEICNGYLELNDAKDLKQRFQKTFSERPHLNPDPQFENAMDFGLPPCAGNALGIDRVIAILLGLESISPLYPIPFLSQFPKGSIAWE